MSNTVTYSTIATNQVVNGQSDVYWEVPQSTPSNFYAVNIITADMGKLSVTCGSINGHFGFDITNKSGSAITYDVVLMTVSNDGSTADSHTANQVK